MKNKYIDENGIERIQEASGDGRQGFLDKSAQVTTGTGDGAKNKRLNLATTYASATNTTQFTPVDNVRQVYFTAIPDASQTDNSVECIITFDATSDAVEQGWLNQGASPSLIWPNISIPINGERQGPYTFPDYLARIGALPGVLCELIAEAN